MVVTGLVSSLGAPLIPQMVQYFGVSLNEAQWILTLPMIVGAVASPLLGRIATPSRRKPILICVLMLVCLGLVLCTAPLGFTAVLVGRGLQGLGIALGPVTMAIARRELPAVATLSAAVVAAAGVSFPIVSIVAGWAGVPAAYAVGLALSILGLSLVWWAVPRAPSECHAPQIDWMGAGLLTIGAGTILVVLSQLGNWSPWVSESPWV